MTNPLISVLMTAYNAEKHIERAICSILNQTYCHFEFIIVNDGSTDKTADIIKSFSDERIVFIDNQQNSKMIGALNEGIEIAKGEYIARMDSDDESLPERFKMQIDFIRQNPEIDVLGTAMFVVGGKNSPKKHTAPKHHQQCLEALLHGPCIYHPTAMIRKTTLKNIRYNPKCPVAEDYKLWTDLAKNGAKFANLTTPLLNYHWHGENESIVKKSEQKACAILIQLDYMAYSFEINYADSTALSNTDIILSLPELSTIYSNAAKDKKTMMLKLLRYYIHANISTIGFSFSPKTNGVLRLYWLKYKTKAWFKKPHPTPKSQDLT